MDDKRHQTGHLMLITPDRVFYAGLLGRPRERCPGAFHVYVSIEGGLWLTTGTGHESLVNWRSSRPMCGTPSPASIARRSVS